MAVKALDEAHGVISTAFDPAFYRATYPDVATAGVDALWHYQVAGWREGRDPAPWFSNRAYLEAYADVQRQHVDPFLHYLTRGAGEGRTAFASEFAKPYLRSAGQLRAARAAQPDPVAASETGPASAPGMSVEGARAVVAAEFDPAFYLAAYPDIAGAGADPLGHFLATGWREGRQPNAVFSPAEYLEANPDVAAAGVNPFWHYLRAGRAEGRQVRLDLGFRYRILASRVGLAERLARAAEAASLLTVGRAADLAKSLADATARLRRLHVTFSHDDYSAVVGGLQLCLRRESESVRRLGFDHLHIHPAVSSPVVRKAGEPGPMGVLLNGEPLGIFAAADVAPALAQALKGVSRERRSLAVHSLLGHTPEDVIAIAAALDVRSAVFWLHDFASLCAGYHLVRNDVEDCAAPAPESAACRICDYGPERARHTEAHRILFGALRMTVASPSAQTLAFWRARAQLPVGRELVRPHVRLVACGPAPRRRGPFRIAFLGMPIPLKGWPLFADLARRHRDDRRYEFVHIGARSDPTVPAAFHLAVADSVRPQVMREVVETLRVDAALVWPLCRETFSLVAHEAVAAGAAVITGPDSGNVEAFVREGRHGLILPDEAALVEAFDAGAVLTLARSRRKPSLHDMEFSHLTGDLLALGDGE